MKNVLPIIVEVRRGTTIEARHRGAIIAVEPDGRIVAQLGDAEVETSTRSVIKPFQAVPLITTGAADRFKVTPRELAIVCGSHSGEALHTYTVARLLARIGLDENSLQCGAHRPMSEEAAIKIESEGLSFTQLHNNCSGKHAGMLAIAVHQGLTLDDYISPDHPVQQAVIAMLCRFIEAPAPPPIAIDGCSAPTFGLTLRSVALAFSRLAMPWDDGQSFLGKGPDLGEGVKRVVAAMTSQPEMVGGTKGRVDTDIIRAARGKLVCKIGAEAAYGIAVLPNSSFPRGLGIAIKVEDGARRALEPVVIETLAQLGSLSDRELQELASYHRPAVTNHRGTVVGEVRTVFDLGLTRPVSRQL